MVLCIAFNLTAAQFHELEGLHNEALRTVSGLPRYARLEVKQKYARLPPLTPTITARKESNTLFHRHSTRQCQQLLEATGEDPQITGEDRTLITGTISFWEDIEVVDDISHCQEE